LIETWQRQRFREALARAVLGPDLALSMPLLLLIEDVQWCDCETLDWLPYLLRLNPRAKLLIVATLRTEMMRQDCSLDDLLTELRRRGLLTEMNLQPLDQPDTLALAQQVAGGQLDTGRAAQIYRETEGVPLFVVEFMRAGLTLPVDVTTEGLSILPPVVQAAMAARLAQLSAPARQVMELAAVIGREFTFEVLSSAVGIDEDSLVQALDELWQRHIIREQGQDAYNFSHDKLRQVAYSRLSAIRRRWLHRKAAEALATSQAAAVGLSGGQIGWHYEQAGENEAAAHWLRQAGEAAARVGALSEALAYHQRVLRLTPETSLVQRYDSWLACEQIYHLQSARELQANALAALDKLAAALTDPARRARTAVEQGRYQIEVADFPVAIQAVHLALQSVAQAKLHTTTDTDKSHPLDLARVEFEAYEVWGTALICQGDAPAATVQVEHALGLARAAGLRREEAGALSNLAHITPTRHAAIVYLEAALPIYHTVADKVGECTCLQFLGYACLYQREYDRAVDCYGQSLGIARQIGFRRGEVDALYLLGHYHNQIGDSARGRDYLEQALTMAREDHNQRRAAYALFNLAVSGQRLNQLSWAIERAREAVLICQTIGDMNAEAIAWMIVGSSHAAAQQWREAADAYERALTAVQLFADPPSTAELQARLAYVVLQLGDVTRARRLVEEVLHYAADDSSQIGADEGPVPAYLHCYRVLSTLGDSRADASLETAHRLLHEQAARFTNETVRRSFLENKPENREVLAAWEQMHDRPV
jgi:tetratricopeptide (TPR) repeat protein